MATLSSPGTSIHPQSSQTSRRTAPQRLRESCEPCSAAKVRCSKEKPYCSRCIERDLPCMYFATRRAGRPPNKLANGGKAASRNNNDGAHISSSQSSSSLDGLAGFSCFPSSVPRSDTISLRDSVRTPFMPSPSTGFDPSLSVPSANLDEWGSRELDDFFATFVNIPSLSPAPDGFMQTGPGSPMQITPTSPSSTFKRHSVGGCTCLTTALALLSKSGEDHGLTSVKQPFSRTESLISENEGVAAAVNDILQCKCAQDANVLIILALVVSKVLGRYGRAARVAPMIQSPSPLPSRRSSKQYYLHGEDSDRVAGQLVLGELHRALKLVNELATKLNDHRRRCGESEWLRRPSSTAASHGNLDDEGTVSFSSSMLDQLGSDLREQLKTVTGTITQMLKSAV